MKALSIRPPWAWAILRAGKRLENRSWRTEYRGPLAIHASQTLAPDDLAALSSLGYAPPPEEFVRSALVGVATLVDIVPLDQVAGDPWARGPYCWVLEDVCPLRSPIPASGQLSLWTPSKRLVERISKEARQARPRRP